MLATRGAWTTTLAILAIPFLALAFLVAMGARDRIDRAEAASDALDGIFPFATVAAIEGALHEEGSLAIAYAAGLIDRDELGAATAATDAARTELLDELGYHDPDSAIGLALAEIERGMAAIDDTRAQLVAGTLDGPASAPYRSVLGATAEATRATLPSLSPPTLGAVPLAHLDAARRAAGEAVFESTASIFEGRDTAAVAEALVRLAAADLLLRQTAPPALAAEVATALASPDATLGAEGTAMIAGGELPDLFAWADATVPWVLAYGDPEGAELEAGVSIMGARAERAEQAALEFVIVAAAAWTGLFALTALLVHSVLTPRAPSGDRRAAVAVMAGAASSA